MNTRKDERRIAAGESNAMRPGEARYLANMMKREGDRATAGLAPDRSDECETYARRVEKIGDATREWLVLLGRLYDLCTDLRAAVERRPSIGPAVVADIVRDAASGLETYIRGKALDSIGGRIRIEDAEGI